MPRLPDGFRCVQCGQAEAFELPQRRLWQCKACGRQTSLTSGASAEPRGPRRGDQSSRRAHTGGNRDPGRGRGLCGEGFRSGARTSKRRYAWEPTRADAAFLLARSIRAQYLSRLDTAENTSRAGEAIVAYRQVLAVNPNQDEAYEASVSLYEAVHDDAGLREWVLQRAHSGSVPSARRAAAYLLLARKDWDCA